jgi:hypothetical protein
MADFGRARVFRHEKGRYLVGPRSEFDSSQIAARLPPQRGVEVVTWGEPGGGAAVPTAELRRALLSDEWIVVLLERQPVVAAPAVDAPKPQEKSAPKKPAQIVKEKSFLDVRFTDDEGAPMAGADYELQLPSGLKERGTLDGSGRVQKQNIDPGTGRIRLLDAPGPPVDPGDDTDAVDWLELHLCDEDGGPLADCPVTVKLPNGEERAVTTDENGDLRLAGLPPGPCEVSLPTIDDDLWAVSA